jgi:hypothetical protein
MEVSRNYLTTAPIALDDSVKESSEKEMMRVPIARPFFVVVKKKNSRENCNFCQEAYRDIVMDKFIMHPKPI